MAGNGKKTSESRKHYYARASTIITKNKNRRTKNHESWSEKKKDQQYERSMSVIDHSPGLARRARRAKWLASTGTTKDGNPATSFAKFEKRESGLSKWDSDHQPPRTVTTLSTDNINLLKSLQNVRAIRLAA